MRCRDVWRRCPARRDIPPIFPPVWRSFTSGPGVVDVYGQGRAVRALSRAIGAVSPPGGDISEPVSQATLRIVKVFWGLSQLSGLSAAFPRHRLADFSYSLYVDRLAHWFDENVDQNWTGSCGCRTHDASCRQESELEEIVRLVGMDALSLDDRLTHGGGPVASGRTICIRTPSMRWIPIPLPRSSSSMLTSDSCSLTSTAEARRLDNGADIEAVLTLAGSGGDRPCQVCPGGRGCDGDLRHIRGAIWQEQMAALGVEGGRRLMLKGISAPSVRW